jgi:hypothetical protein
MSIRWEAFPDLAKERGEYESIEEATEQTAAWDVSAALRAATHAAGEDLTRRILLQLPAGYDLLFGRPRPG